MRIMSDSKCPGCSATDEFHASDCAELIRLPADHGAITYTECDYCGAEGARGYCCAECARAAAADAAAELDGDEDREGREAAE
jgi:hypothetical protein